MNTKLKYAVAACLVTVILLSSSQVFLFTSYGQEDNSSTEKAYWLQMAENAWNYFQPGNGVNSQTGLHGGGLGWPYFTDWDLGLYIQAIIDVEELGIINNTGPWGANNRYDKILTFLETRELTSNDLPYQFYNSETSGRFGDQQGNACDTGKLLIALHNLKVHRPDLVARIDHIVYNRTNYELYHGGWEALFSRLSIYDYYVTTGFAFFWPDNFTTLPDTFLNNIVSAPALETYGVKLPKASLASEVLLHSIFELEPNSKLTNLTQQIYLAHEAKYNATGKFVAFSEGNTDQSDPSYIYEMVVEPDGRTWTIIGLDSNSTISPIIYLKVAIAFKAIYGTAFANDMADYVTSHIPLPDRGYADGIDENGRVVKTTIDKTNGIIIEAAKYAINNLPKPAPTPTQSPNPTPSIQIPTITPAPANMTIPSTNPTASASPSPTFSSSPSPTPSSNQNQDQTTIIIIITVVGCAFLLTPLLFLLKRNSNKKTQNT